VSVLFVVAAVAVYIGVAAAVLWHRVLPRVRAEYWRTTGVTATRDLAVHALLLSLVWPAYLPFSLFCDVAEWIAEKKEWTP